MSYLVRIFFRGYALWQLSFIMAGGAPRLSVKLVNTKNAARMYMEMLSVPVNPYLYEVRVSAWLLVQWPRLWCGVSHSFTNLISLLRAPCRDTHNCTHHDARHSILAQSSFNLWYARLRGAYTTNMCFTY